ncbi:MAG: glycosyltransferase family 2 protein [Rikenellaceae bacterium]
MELSLVIPLYNEVDSLTPLMAWIDRVVSSQFSQYEVLLIDDGSSDSSWEMVLNLKKEYDYIKGIRFSRNYGKAAALYHGFKMAQGDVVITMDADMQDSPDEVPELYRMIKEEGYDLVSGWKKQRYDPLGKTMPSKLFNSTARIVSGIKLHDFNCGLKAYKRQVIKSIEVYGEMHRYIPILAKQAGFKKIGEKIVEHRAREFGVSKYGIERMIKGYLDLLTVMFMGKFGRSPMYMFGSLGTLMFIVGFVLVIYLIGYKHYLIMNALPQRPITDQPLFFISLTSIVMGTQLFLAGFLGQLIDRNGSEKNHYLIDEIVDK